MYIASTFCISSGVSWLGVFSIHIPVSFFFDTICFASFVILQHFLLSSLYFRTENPDTSLWSVDPRRIKLHESQYTTYYISKLDHSNLTALY